MDSKQRAAEQRAEEIVEYIAVNEWDDRKVLALILAALRAEREACARGRE